MTFHVWRLKNKNTIKSGVKISSLDALDAEETQHGGMRIFFKSAHSNKIYTWVDTWHSRCTFNWWDKPYKSYDDKLTRHLMLSIKSSLSAQKHEAGGQRNSVRSLVSNISCHVWTLSKLCWLKPNFLYDINIQILLQITYSVKKKKDINFTAIPWFLAAVVKLHRKY